MSELSRYVMVSLDILIALVWIILWWRSPAARARNWQAYTMLAAIPVAMVSQWWWSRPLTLLGLTPTTAPFEIIAAFSLCLSIIATYPRRLLNIPFARHVQLKWGRYLTSLAGLVGAAYCADLFEIPRGWVLIVSGILIAVGSFYLSSNRPLMIRLQGLSLLISFILVASIGLLIGNILPGPQHSILGIDFIFSTNQGVALLALALSWPSIANWWLNQSPPTAS